MKTNTPKPLPTKVKAFRALDAVVLGFRLWRLARLTGKGPMNAKTRAKAVHLVACVSNDCSEYVSVDPLFRCSMNEAVWAAFLCPASELMRRMDRFSAD